MLKALEVSFLSGDARGSKKSFTENNLSYIFSNNLKLTKWESNKLNWIIIESGFNQYFRSKLVVRIRIVMRKLIKMLLKFWNWSIIGPLNENTSKIGPFNLLFYLFCPFLIKSTYFYLCPPFFTLAFLILNFEIAIKNVQI